MLRDVTDPSKAFLIMERRQSSAALLWVTGLFLFSLALGVLLQNEAAQKIDWLRRYSLQIFLFVSLLHQFFLMGWRPLIKISKKAALFSLIAIFVYLSILKALDFFAEIKLGVSLGHRRSFDSWDQIFLSLVLAPIFEELFFRDLLFRALYSRDQKLWLSILFSSAFFMVAHLSLYPGAFVLGIVSALLLYFSGSILPSIFFHLMSNLSWFFLPMLFPNLFRVLIEWDLLWIFYR
jgi:membrane protease YdiL (CAAX protease family)